MQILSYNEEPLTLNIAFSGLDIIAVRMKKSNQWLYGIYRANKRLGFLYEGEGMSLEDQLVYANVLLPEDKANINYYVQKFKDRAAYHESLAENFVQIGHNENTHVIQKK